MHSNLKASGRIHARSPATSRPRFGSWEMGRVDYYHDSRAPAANSLVVGSSAIVVDTAGCVLLQRRSDSGLWALPGGTMDIGETFAQSAVRKVKEETGFDVQIQRIVGIYSDPGHVFAYDDGEVRQEFNICLLVRSQVVPCRSAANLRLWSFSLLRTLRILGCMNQSGYVCVTMKMTRLPCCVSKHYRLLPSQIVRRLALPSCCFALVVLAVSSLALLSAVPSLRRAERRRFWF
jgi:8-oxo-dGTP pyrophosphatase MutT (NUDIX family)